MQRIFILFIACIIAIPMYAQQVEQAPEAGEAPEAVEPSEVPEVPEVPEASEAPEVPIELIDTIKVLDKVEVIEAPDNTKVTLGENEVLIIEDNGDTVRVKLGSRGISIVEGDEGTEIKITEMEEPEDEENDGAPEKKKKKKFKPHYAGFEIGFNNFLNDNMEMQLPDGAEYMDLNTGKSWNFNLNIIEYGLGFSSDKVGIVTGLGFELSNYVFDANNTILKTDGVIEGITPEEPQAGGTVVKSSLRTTYITAPLLLELQIPAGKKRIHLSGGIVGGVKIGSRTKVKFEGPKSSRPVKDDYNLSALRYGATVRVGYRAINLFANYYMTPLFSGADDPELFPFSIGLTLIPF